MSFFILSQARIFQWIVDNGKEKSFYDSAMWVKATQKLMTFIARSRANHSFLCKNGVKIWWKSVARKFLLMLGKLKWKWQFHFLSLSYLRNVTAPDVGWVVFNNIFLLCVSVVLASWELSFIFKQNLEKMRRKNQ